MSDEAISALASGLETGVYYGWTQIGKVKTQVYPMVMSLGWNPYFKNEKRSAVNIYIHIIFFFIYINQPFIVKKEVHVIHEFPEDFYDAPIRVLVLGFIRPEQNYPSLGKKNQYLYVSNLKFNLSKFKNRCFNQRYQDRCRSS